MGVKSEGREGLELCSGYVVSLIGENLVFCLHCNTHGFHNYVNLLCLLIKTSTQLIKGGEERRMERRCLFSRAFDYFPFKI